MQESLIMNISTFVKFREVLDIVKLLLNKCFYALFFGITIILI